MIRVHATVVFSAPLMPFDRSVARLIDHTILKPEATRDEVRQVCAESRKYEFASVCVNAFWVPLGGR